MWVGVLGPTVVAETSAGAGLIPLPAAKHRALLAALALHAGRPASADVLVAAMWGVDAPPSAQATLQTYVSVVRRTLEPDLPARTPSRHLVSSDLGYQLHADVDAEDFARTVRDVHATLGPLSGSPVPVCDDVEEAQRQRKRLEEALALWRGEPYADLADSDLVQPERARLGELRLLALEDHATVLVATGEHARAATELEALTAEHPLRERLWTLLAVALARAGRQADALAALARLRTALAEQLGIDPTPAVRALQTAILRQELPPGPSGAGDPRTQAQRTGGPASRPSPPEPEITVPSWPLVGREAHLEVLSDLLAQADGGRPQFVTLVGEPGAGKTRLGAELALRARAAGALVLVGRCSQEEDAPPLWPWSTALGDLMPAIGAEPVPTPADRVGPADLADHDAARFALADAVRRTLTDLARDRTVILGLEDLHWADAFSLRVLRHLCAHADTGRLLVVCTWRRGVLSPALAETTEALARRHVTNLELTGLSADETANLLTALTGEADAGLATSLHRRTEGNPFFLIEYGRLARDRHTALASTAEEMPPTIAAVVERRIVQLPQAVQRALTAGAAIGRDFDLTLLAGALGTDELEALDLLEPALAVELVQDLGGDRFRFVHALVRDTAYGVLGPSRRERLHATLAQLVADAPDADRRASEIARHWAAAGSRHVRRAHTAAAHAGALALAAHAPDEARRQFAAALTLHAEDPVGAPRERFELLVSYADACRWSTRHLEMHHAIDEAVVIAAGLDEPELVHRAVAISTEDALWPARAYGERNLEVIGAIQAALGDIPSADAAVRCRLLLAFASEAYYDAAPDEVHATCEDAIAMARRLADAGLLLEALAGAAAIDYRRSTAVARRAWCEEAMDLATRAGDERAAIKLRTLLACVRCELGDVAGLEQEIDAIARLAHEKKLYFVEMVALTLAHSWAAMRGDEDEITDVFGRLVECFELVSTAHKVDTVRGAALFVPLWDPQAPIPAGEEVMAYMRESAIPVAPAAAVLALRHGQQAEAHALLAQHGIDLDTDNWYSPFLWSLGAEIGLRLQQPDVAAAAYRKLAPYAGSCVMSGTAPAHGPVDAYLAVAAAATGETSLATQHAETALELVRAWRLHRVETWFLDLREQHGF